MDLLKTNYLPLQSPSERLRVAKMVHQSLISLFLRRSPARPKSPIIRKGACTIMTRTDAATWGPTPQSSASTPGTAAQSRTSARWLTTALKNFTILRNLKRSFVRHSRRLLLKDFINQQTLSQRLREKRKKVRPMTSRMYTNN